MVLLEKTDALWLLRGIQSREYVYKFRSKGDWRYYMVYKVPLEDFVELGQHVSERKRFVFYQEFSIFFNFRQVN